MKITHKLGILISLLSNTFVYSQNLYISEVGDSLRKAGELSEAINEYKKVYSIHPDNPTNTYNLACALAVNEQYDSSFIYLEKYILLDTSDYPLCDPDFSDMTKDKRWIVFEDRLINMINHKTNNSIRDINYAKKLWKMLAKDQSIYYDIEIVEKKLGMNSSVVKSLWKLKSIYNEENQKEVEKLIRTKGCPKISKVGVIAANSAFLIIQHSDLEKQKKYLPKIERECKKNEAKWKNYALLYDRIQVKENKPQKFGSQIKYNQNTNSYELFPLLDESKVDEWRKEMGLSPLAEYVANWGIILRAKQQ